MLELFAWHLFNVNKEQVLPYPGVSSPPSQVFINTPGTGEAAAGERARPGEAEWVFNVEAAGAAAFGEQEPSRFGWNWREFEIRITGKGARTRAGV